MKLFENLQDENVKKLEEINTAHKKIADLTAEYDNCNKKRYLIYSFDSPPFHSDTMKDYF